MESIQRRENPKPINVLIDGIENCFTKEWEDCEHCAYNSYIDDDEEWANCQDRMLKDCLYYLKEAVTPVKKEYSEVDGCFLCEKCGCYADKDDNYCRSCGRIFKKDE